MAKSKKGAGENKTVVIETFKPIGAYEISNMRQDEPSAFNRDVRFRKFRITIEEIEEPSSVLAERLQHLWENCDNHHNALPILTAAHEIGCDLKGDAGCLKKNKV